MDEHNGWQAYRYVCDWAGLTSDLWWYARPDEDTTGYLLTEKRKRNILRIIEKGYGVTLYMLSNSVTDLVSLPYDKSSKRPYN